MVLSPGVAMSGRWLLVALVSIGTLALADLGSRAQNPTDTPATRENIEAALKLAQAAAAEYEMLLTGDDKPLELIREPVLRWSNPVVGEIHGNVYLWVRDGQPMVIASLHKWFSPKTHFEHELQSLAEGPLTAKFHGAAAWETSGRGLHFADLPEAAAPAATRAQRLFQMKQLAKEFAVTKKAFDGTESELRLLSQPVHRYAVPEKGVVDGALFAFVQGTDPDLLLLVEARGENVAKARWQFAAARMTMAEVRLRHRDKEVWKADFLPADDVYDHKHAYTNFVFKEIPDFLKDALAKPKP
jgi:hypothetical protein